MLYDCAMTLQHTDFTNTEAASKAFEKVNLILEFFDDHADHEDAHFLPMVKKTHEALVHEFEQEHVKDRELSINLKNALAAYSNAQNDEERIQAGHKIFYGFNAFIAFNLEHTNKEETVLNEALWANYTDAEIIAANGRLIATIPPAKSAISVKWMMKGCSDVEIVQFIRAVKTVAPPPMVEMLMQIAENELSQHRKDIIMPQLAIETTLA